MFARMTTIKGIPEKVDIGIEQFRERTARSSEIEGFQGFYLLVDRKSGKMVAVTLWETEQAMQASAARAAQQRAQATGTAAVSEPPTVEMFEVALKR
jgi:heme-degrading monooxygenase HmoA